MAGRDYIGPVSFQVRMADGHIRKHYVDHVRIWYPEETSEPTVVEGGSISSPNGTTQQSEEVVSGNCPIVSSLQRHDPLL